MTSELVKPGTHFILMKKNVSALCACSPLVSLARTGIRHNATPQEKMLHQLSLAHQSSEWINDKYQDTTILINFAGVSFQSYGLYWLVSTKARGSLVNTACLDISHGIAPPGLAAFWGLELKYNQGLVVISSLTNRLSLWSTDPKLFSSDYLMQIRPHCPEGLSLRE